MNKLVDLKISTNQLIVFSVSFEMNGTHPGVQFWGTIHATEEEG